MNYGYNPDKNIYYKGFNLKHYFKDNPPFGQDNMVFAHAELMHKSGHTSGAYMFIWWHPAQSSVLYISSGVKPNFFPTGTPEHTLNAQAYPVEKLAGILLDACKPLAAIAKGLAYDSPSANTMYPFAKGALNSLYHKGFISEWQMGNFGEAHVSKPSTFNKVPQVQHAGVVEVQPPQWDDDVLDQWISEPIELQEGDEP